MVGLIADLGARPLKGAGYAAGRTAVVDATGMMATATGNATDCVHVDGSSGPCGAAAPAFVDADTLSGIVDGSNTTFGLSAVPDPAASLSVYRNGMMQKAGIDYSLSGSTIGFLTGATPQPGDTLLASYRTTGDESAPPAPFTSTQVLCSGSGSAATTAVVGGVGHLQHTGWFVVARRSRGTPVRLPAPGQRRRILARSALGRDHRGPPRRRVI